MKISSKLAARAAWMAAVCLFSLSTIAHAQSVPSPWSASDIGSPRLPGSSRFLNGNFSIDAAGDDIWNRSDQFHFVYRPIAGDVEIIARIDTFSAPHWWAKAGVMIRGSLAANAPHASALLSSENGIVFQRRTAAGGDSASSAGPWVTSPYWVRLVRAGTSVTAYSSIDGTRWELIESSTIPLGATAYVGIAVTSHDEFALARAVVSNVRVSTSAPQQPPQQSALTAADVGAPAIAGGTSFDGGTYTIRAGGTDIWDRSDQFHYAYTQMSGDVDIVARVGSLTQTDLWARAGLMIRESLGANSRHAMALTTAGRGYGFQRRIDTGGWSDVDHTATGAAPIWLRLVRSGSVFRAYHSATGSNWILTGTDTIPMNVTVYVGLAVTSRNASRATVAVIDNLRVGTGATVPEPTPPPEPTPVPPAAETPPRAVAFLASADHDTLVTRYILEIYTSAANAGVSTPVAASDLGKPARAANGEITVDRFALFEALAPGSYIATVTAVGDGGSSRSLTAAFTR